MIRLTFTVLAALCIGCLSLPTVGADDGYTYRDGYWWSGGTAYTRTATQVLVPGSTYCQNGRLYTNPGYYRTDYAYSAVVKAAYTPPVYTPPAVPTSAADPDWRIKLLELAQARDKGEAGVRKAAIDQKYFLESVQALGLQGNFRIDGYGASPFGPGAAYGGYSSSTYGYLQPLNGVYTHQLQYGGYGVQNNTVYGTSLKQYASLYGDTDLNALYQQASRLTENAQRLGGQATADFSTLVGQAGTNQQRVAEIIARADAAQRLLQSIDGPPRTETKTLEFGPAPPPMATPPGAAALPAGRAPGSRAAFEANFRTDCAACHTGANAKGKFTLEAYYTLSPVQKAQVWQLLVTKDKNLMMPRSRDGGPGEYIGIEKFKLWLEN